MIVELPVDDVVERASRAARPEGATAGNYRRRTVGQRYLMEESTMQANVYKLIGEVINSVGKGRKRVVHRRCWCSMLTLLLVWRGVFIWGQGATQQPMACVRASPPTTTYIHVPTVDVTL